MKIRGFRMPDDLYDRLPARKRGQFVRQAVRAALDQARQPQPAELEELALQRRELVAVGRNLNQIARQLNAAATGGADHPSYREIEAAARKVASVVGEISADLAKWRGRS